MFEHSRGLAQAGLLCSLMALAPGCAGVLRDGVFTDGHTRFRVGSVPPSWELVKLEGNDVAYISRDSPHSIAVNATCEDHDDPPLDTLTRHLLMGFTERSTLDQQTFTLDDREALRTQVSARLDGVPVELVLVVMKKDGCVYDFTYLSPPSSAGERLGDFEHLLAQFSTEARP
jgi:hypothetical protein